MAILHYLSGLGSVADDKYSDNNPSNLQFAAPARNKARHDEIHQDLNDSSQAQSQSTIDQSCFLPDILEAKPGECRDYFYLRGSQKQLTKSVGVSPVASRLPSMLPLMSANTRVTNGEKRTQGISSRNGKCCSGNTQHQRHSFPSRE